MSSKTFLDILEELGWPNVYLVDYRQFEKVDGCTIKGSYGIAAAHHPVITVKRGLRGRVLRNVLYHEIAHHLFPYHPHWWIECAAERMAGGGGRGYWSSLYGHSVDEMPSRSTLLKRFRMASTRFNAKEKEHGKHKTNGHGIARCGKVAR
jgi:hypothetical protein